MRASNASSTTMRALRIAAIVLISGVAVCIAYYSYWSYQWGRAETLAKEFCGSVAVGSDLSSALARAKAMDRKVAEGLEEGRAYYAVSFPGPIFNVFMCEINAADGKVTSKRLIEPKD